MSSRTLLLTALSLLSALPVSLANHAPLATPAATAPAGKVFMTRDEALALAFPKCEVKRSTKYLSKADIKAVAELGKVDFESSIVYPYIAKKDGKLVGTAYFDTHRVRTMRETLMVVVGTDNAVKRIEVLSFGEPTDYIPRASWYAQFPGRKLDSELHLKRKIKTVTGATLTAKATTSCARRVLALHNTLARLEKEKAEKARKKKGPVQGAAEARDPR